MKFVGSLSPNALVRRASDYWVFKDFVSVSTVFRLWLTYKGLFRIFMVNPGSFQGTRKEFLLGEKAAYKVAVTGGYARDALSIIQGRFLRRFPIDLSLSVEPTPEELAAVNDETPDLEYEAPDEEKMTPDEFSEATKAFEDRQSLIQFRKDVSNVVLCLLKFVND